MATKNKRSLRTLFVLNTPIVNYKNKFFACFCFVFLLLNANLYAQKKANWEDFVSFYRDGKWGFRKKSGGMVIKPEYEEVSEFFSEGLAAVKYKGEWGFIDETGEVVIPIRYKMAFYFREGLAHVYDGEKWGYIDKKNKTVIPFVYSVANPFINGEARVSLDGNNEFFINKKGKCVKKCP
jgi:hypothetical protein